MKFSFKPILKQKKVQRKTYTATINFNDEGIISAFIELDSVSEIKDLRCVKLSDKSLSLKGKEEIYLYDKDTNKYTRIIRTKSHAVDFPSLFPYLPFKLGGKCKGTIINNNGINEFEITQLL